MAVDFFREAGEREGKITPKTKKKKKKKRRGRRSKKRRRRRSKKKRRRSKNSFLVYLPSFSCLLPQIYIRHIYYREPERRKF